MSRYLTTCAATAVLGAATAAMMSLPVSAQADAFKATPTSGPRGTIVSVSSVAPCVLPTGVTGAPFARITLTQGATVIATGSFSASSSGAWSGTLTVGSNAALGSATLGGDCFASPQAEGTLLDYQDMPFTVTPSPVSGATTTPTGMSWGGSHPVDWSRKGLPTLTCRSPGIPARPPQMTAAVRRAE
jgi:hypothetical protein